MVAPRVADSTGTVAQTADDLSRFKLLDVFVSVITAVRLTEGTISI